MRNIYFRPAGVEYNAKHLLPYYCYQFLSGLHLQYFLLSKMVLPFSQKWAVRTVGLYTSRKMDYKIGLAFMTITHTKHVLLPFSVSCSSRDVHHDKGESDGIHFGH